MKSTIARVLISSGALLLAGASMACVDEARCDAALAGVARVRAESARRETQRDAQLAWLRWWQTSMAVQLQGVAASAGNDALNRKLAALEAENAALTLRLSRAERRIDEAGAAAPPVDREPAAHAPSYARRLDEDVPYDLTGFLARPRPSARREANGTRREARPSRRLDERMPYDLRPHDDAPAAQRTLDETVPYE